MSDKWGPAAWSFLQNSVRHGDRQLARDLLTNLPQWLPCKKCRVHARKYISTHPIPHKRKRMSIWLRNFRNAVNNTKVNKQVNQVNLVKIQNRVRGITRSSGGCHACGSS